MKKRAKITDVATLAGVSSTTVSIILKDPENNRFSKGTIEKVLEAVESLQYQPAIYAQQMRGKRLSVIGLIIPDLMNHYYPEVISGFTKQANELNYNVILLDSNNDISKEQCFADNLIAMRVSGVAITGVYTPDERETEIIERLISSGIPVVQLDRYDLKEVCPFVGIDNYLAGYYIIEKLIQAGHRDIVCLSPNKPVFIVSERVRGYMDAIKDNGLNERYYKFDNDTFGDIFQTVMRMWNSGKRATAIFTPGGDMDAIECIKSSAILNIKVPDELSIAGFDDIYVANLINPSLTTIRQPKFRMGESAMKLLHKMILKEDLEVSKILLPFEYIARESTKVFG